MSRVLKNLALAALGVVCMAYPLLADVTGTLTGIVKDQSGGVTPGATVTVTNSSTGATYNNLVDETGTYTIRALPVGVYNLTAELTGFKKFEAKGIRLQVNEIVRVDVALSVGTATETVEVIANAVNVDTTTPTLKSVVDQMRIEELPLNGRDAVQLMKLIVGVQTWKNPASAGRNDTELTSGTTYPGTQAVSVNGARGNTTNYVLDGGQNNDHYNNAPNPMPNPDALQEFSVQTNTFSAEFGRNVGGIVNAVTKSGTNELHGSVFEYVRNKAFNAANFFSPPKTGSPNEKQDDGLKRNQFGFTVGGPVWLPRLYNGKSKSFFFFSYQGTRTRQNPVSVSVIVPTAAERRGDFSATKTPLKNPFSGGTFANNQIPAALMNALSVSLLENFVPLPSGSGNTISFSRLSNLDDDQVLVKGDHQLTSKSKLSGRFWVSNAIRPGMYDPKNYLITSNDSTWRNTSVAVSETHIFGPGTINTALFSFNRTLGQGFRKIPQGLAGMGVKVYNDPDFPQISVSVSGNFSIAAGGRSAFTRDEYQGSDTLRWTKGRHQFSIGGEFGHGLGDVDNLYRTDGVFSFSSSAPFTGNALADYMVGKFSSMQQGIGEFKRTRVNMLAMFVQDSIRLARRFTVDVGLRWDPFFPYTDADGKLAAWRPGQQSTRFVNAPKGVLYAGDPGLPTGGYDKAWMNFGPRVGFAWDVMGDGKTSVRAGYGIFYDRPNSIATNSSANQSPFGTLVTNYGNMTNGFMDPYAGAVNPFPSTTTPGSSAPFVLPHTAFLFEEHMRNAYIQSWNLTIEREVAGLFIARGSYAASKGTRLVTGRDDANLPVYYPGATTSTTNERRPLYPTFANIRLIEATTNSNFHSMQLTAEKRFSNRFSILGNYMLSKAMDDSSNNKGTLMTRTPLGGAKYDHGPSDFDKTHVFNFSGLWELPSNLGNRFANVLLGGWRMTGILNLQTGTPFTVYSGVDNARTGTSYQRSDIVGNPILPDNRSRGEKIAMWLNKAAFVPNALGTYGKQGRDMWRGPGRANVDLGLHKDFKVLERMTLQFRFEMFNAFNRVNLDQAYEYQSSANFMKTTTAFDPRILQFALRIVF